MAHEENCGCVDCASSEDVPQSVTLRRKIKVRDFLTDEQLALCCALHPDRARIRDEVLVPNISEIDRKLGQANDPNFLSFAIVYAFDRAMRRRAS